MVNTTRPAKRTRRAISSRLELDLKPVSLSSSPDIPKNVLISALWAGYSGRRGSKSNVSKSNPASLIEVSSIQGGGVSASDETAEALWYVGPGRAEIREERLKPLTEDKVRVRALYGAI